MGKWTQSLTTALPESEAGKHFVAGKAHFEFHYVRCSKLKRQDHAMPVFSVKCVIMGNQQKNRNGDDYSTKEKEYD